MPPALQGTRIAHAASLLGDKVSGVPRSERAHYPDGRRCNRWYLIDQHGGSHLAVIGVERDTKDGHYSYSAVREQNVDLCERHWREQEGLAHKDSTAARSLFGLAQQDNSRLRVLLQHTTQPPVACYTAVAPLTGMPLHILPQLSRPLLLIDEHMGHPARARSTFKDGHGMFNPVLTPVAAGRAICKHSPVAMQQPGWRVQVAGEDDHAPRSRQWGCWSRGAQRRW